MLGFFVTGSFFIKLVNSAPLNVTLFALFSRESKILSPSFLIKHHLISQLCFPVIVPWTFLFCSHRLDNESALKSHSLSKSAKASLLASCFSIHCKPSSFCLTDYNKCILLLLCVRPKGKRFFSWMATFPQLLSILFLWVFLLSSTLCWQPLSMSSTRTST